MIREHAKLSSVDQTVTQKTSIEDLTDAELNAMIAEGIEWYTANQAH